MIPETEKMSSSIAINVAQFLAAIAIVMLSLFAMLLSIIAIPLQESAWILRKLSVLLLVLINKILKRASMSMVGKEFQDSIRHIESIIDKLQVLGVEKIKKDQ